MMNTLGNFHITLDIFWGGGRCLHFPIVQKWKEEKGRNWLPIPPISRLCACMIFSLNIIYRYLDFLFFPMGIKLRVVLISGAILGSTGVLAMHTCIWGICTIVWVISGHPQVLENCDSMIGPDLPQTNWQNEDTCFHRPNKGLCHF